MGAEASKAAEPEAEEVEVPETPLDLLMKAFFKGESAAVLALIDEHKEEFVGAKVGSARDVCAIGGELVNPTQRSAEAFDKRTLDLVDALFAAANVKGNDAISKPNFRDFLQWIGHPEDEYSDEAWKGTFDGYLAKAGKESEDENAIMPGGWRKLYEGDDFAAELDFHHVMVDDGNRSVMPDNHNISDEPGVSVLALACMVGDRLIADDAEFFTKLCELGAPIDEPVTVHFNPHWNGMVQMSGTALWVAVAFGQFKTVKKLLSLKATLDVPGSVLGAPVAADDGEELLDFRGKEVVINTVFLLSCLGGDDDIINNLAQKIDKTSPLDSKTLAWGALLAIESGSKEAIAQVKEIQDAHGDAEQKAANEKTQHERELKRAERQGKSDGVKFAVDAISYEESMRRAQLRKQRLMAAAPYGGPARGRFRAR